jgi:hypothetical protein
MLAEAGGFSRGIGLWVDRGVWVCADHCEAKDEGRRSSALSAGDRGCQIVQISGRDNEAVKVSLRFRL